MELTREQLYEMLWTDGVGKTEKALGLKQQELQAICEQFEIPKPSSNYWIALSLGKDPLKTPLPPFKDNQPIHTDDFIKAPRVKKVKTETSPAEPVKTLDGKYEPRELPAEEPPTIYTVPEKLIAMDPIILDTKAKLRERNSRQDNPWSKKNPYKNTPKKWLDITVSEDQEDRALRIFSTIWKAAEAKGYHLKINVDKGSYYTSCSTFIVVRNHEIHVGLREINKQVLKEDGTRDYSKVTGSGRLKFICGQGNEWHNWNLRCAAQDTQYTHLEEKIEQIIDVLENIADERDRAEEERKQAEERQKQEEERKRLEAEKQAQIEKRREIERDLVRELIINVDRSRTATMIREYITKYEAEMVGNMEEKELQKRLKWMREKADYIDPFINREDEWLTEEDLVRLMSPEIIKTKEKRQPSSYGYGQETELSYWQIKNAWWNKK